MTNRKIALASISAVFLLSFYFGIHYNLLDIESIKKFVLSHGKTSPVVYVLIMAIAIVVSPIPSMPLTAASGAVFGSFLGTIYSVIGGTIGAIISFYIARVFGLGLIERILKIKIYSPGPYSEKYIAYFIFFSRLFPIFQFDIISYGAGLTNISLKKFSVATFFGMMPMTFLFAYYGKVLFFGDSLIVGLSTILIVAIFLVPVLIKKYSILGLKDKVPLK